MGNFSAIIFKAKSILLVLFLCASTAYAQYQTNGSATQTSCECFELTPETQFAAGSVWNVTLIDLTQPFDFTFDIFLGCSDAQGADGMAFVLQPLNVNAGTAGNGLGYGGIAPSLSVEYDTFNNGIGNNGEMIEDHMAIMSNGVFNHTDLANTLASPVQMSAASGNVEDCAWHTTRITWDPVTQTLNAYFDDVLRVSYTGNIIVNIFGGNPQVYWGFTAATGNLFNQQQFCINLATEFTFDVNNVCPGEDITFTESSTASNVITGYAWDFGDSNTANGQVVTHSYAAGGTYDVTLTITSDGCTHSFTDQVTILNGPTVDLGPDQIVCDGQSLQLNMPNGLAGGTYAWTPPTYLDNAAAPSPTSTPLADVTYTLTYTENGCEGTDDITLTVPPAVVANAGPDVAICDGESTQLTASGGVGFQWDNTGTLDVGTSATPFASPLTTTTYTVTVSDANNCTDTDDVIVTVNPSPVVDAGPDLTICVGNSVQLNAIGVGAFSWNSDPTLNATNIADPMATPVATTVYTVTLTDANNCSSTDDLTIITTTVLPVDAGPDVTICSGESVQLQGSGAVNYSWDPGIDLDNPLTIDPTFTGTNTTLITLTGTDGTGCSATDEVLITVHQTPVPVVDIAGGTSHCDGEPISLDASNSTGPIVDYLFDFGDQLNPPNTTSTLVNPTFTFPGPGSYIVTLVANTANCTASTTETIDINAVPIADFTFTDPCAGEAFDVMDNSSISVGTITDFIWDFGDGTGSTQMLPTQAYNTNGSYDVELIVGSDGGCSDTLVQTVNVRLTPTLNIAVAKACLGEPSIFTNTSTPNDGTVTYSWNLGDGNQSADFLPFHTYGTVGGFGATLTGVSIEGCSTSESVIAEVNPNPEVIISATDLIGCSPHTMSFDNGSTVSGGAIVSYEWDLGDQTTSSDFEPSVTYAQAGSYDVSLSVTSDEGCESTQQLGQTIEVLTTPDADFRVIPNDTLTMLDPTVRLQNNSVNAASYYWTFGDGETIGIANPTHTYDEVGEYTITLTAYNGICTDEHIAEVTVEPESFIYAPSAFTPNSDGINDVFLAVGIGIESFEIYIFDRWGKEVFHTADIENGWNGTYLGGNAPVGVYAYRIEIINAVEELETIMGHVTLIR